MEIKTKLTFQIKGLQIELALHLEYFKIIWVEVQSNSYISQTYIRLTIGTDFYFTCSKQCHLLYVIGNSSWGRSAD